MEPNTPNTTEPRSTESSSADSSSTDSSSTETGAPTKFFSVTWAELHRDSKVLAWRLAQNAPAGGWRGVVAVTRGGLVPSAVVARELDIRIIETLGSVGYRDKVRLERAQLLKPAILAVEVRGKDWLVVDDLVDTGTTAALVREQLPEAHFATIYAKPEGKDFVDSFVTEVSQDTWILFPWDTELREATPIANLRLGAGMPETMTSG